MNDDIPQRHAAACACFDRGETRSIAFRDRQLSRLREALEAREQRLLEALWNDLRKSPVEAYASEIGWVLNDVTYARRNLRRWARARRARLPWAVLPGRARVVPEPRGVVLIMAPWNYPVQLLLSPLVSAMAAGNVCILKPSEATPTVAREIADMMAAFFPREYIQVCEGGPEVAESLLDQRFDHIFFTGSHAVGCKVMAAAARFPTPVTLELGGKSPCIVCADSDLPATARRIAWGKFMNAGQTCVAPDYVLVDRTVRDSLVAAMQQAVREFYGPDPRSSPEYGRVINRAHWERLRACLGSGTPAWGGASDAKDLYLEPTVLLDPPPDSPVMRAEIFGPILPVLTFDRIDEALDEVRRRPHPLALYLFTRNKDIQRRVQRATRSGGLCVNDIMVQLFSRDLPFGGVGESGHGASHGWAGFAAFSHFRPVVKRALWPDPQLRYPPARVALPAMRRVVRHLFYG